jgi:hypothetical protein
MREPHMTLIVPWLANVQMHLLIKTILQTSRAWKLQPECSPCRVPHLLIRGKWEGISRLGQLLEEALSQARRICGEAHV